MAAIVPIPTTRVSDILVRERLLTQLQGDQLALFQLETQLSSGFRLVLPSDDAPAALRAVALQSLLERKDYAQSNLVTNQSYLGATDAALSNTSNLLASIRGSALSVVSTTNTDAERAAVAIEVTRTLQQLVDIGNQRFRDRYLFAGTQTAEQPYTLVDGFVEYTGNEARLKSFADLDVLFDTNLTGQEVFGGLSSAVQGTTDFNPIVTLRTKLADLRGGQGISPGSIEISDGTNTSVIDLSNAKSVGDVVALIEGNPPLGRTATATVTAQGINVLLNGGALTIRNVGGGTTASELGIVRNVGGDPGPVVGTDLNPIVTLTTPLDNILGVRAQASVPSLGANNNLIFQAKQRGAAFNDVQIVFVDGGPGAAGNETAVYDDSVPSNKTLTITIASGVSTASQIAAAVEAQTPFRALLDPKETGNDGSGVVVATATDPAATGTTSGGSGIEFDQMSGLQIVNGGETYELSFVDAKTVEDLLNVFNGSQAHVHAEINATGTGIDVRSRLSGGDFSIGENGGSTATQLGIRSLVHETPLNALNYRRGVQAVAGTDFVVQRPDGTQLQIDVSGAVTIQDVLNRINQHPDNQDLDPNVRVTARLAEYGNGIELVTADTTGTANLAVLQFNTSTAAISLGLVPPNAAVSAPPVEEGGLVRLTGRDVNPLEVGGVFTSLIRLREALEENDPQAISRAVELLDEAALKMTFSRADLGARQQTLDALQIRLQNETVDLQATLSTEIDADLAAVITEFSSRQAALQASLQTFALAFRFTLLDFL